MNLVWRTYDVIVSNPPYVTEAEKQEMEHNVLDWGAFVGIVCARYRSLCVFIAA